MKKSRIWIIGYFICTISAILYVGMLVYKIDPFFHYKKPLTDQYFYRLDNQRSQNNGIVKHFDYDALITGTSMTENFKTSEMDALFGTTSIKVSFSGGTYKEVNDNIRVALSSNPHLKTVIRGLDMEYFLHDKDAMRQDLGVYPTYLYDDLLYNDVKYLFNRNVIFERVYPMLTEKKQNDFEPGITSFDDYSYWASFYTYGAKEIAALDSPFVPMDADPVRLTDSEREMLIKHIDQNIISLTKEYPDTTFYYFFTPYSILAWRNWVSDGSIYRQIEAERIIIEEVLRCENIKLFSFNNLTDLTTNLNNYKDMGHYGPWINSLILRYMKDEKCQLTYENYEKYLEDLKFYTTYDYSKMYDQIDYEDDYYAEFLLNNQISGQEPRDVLLNYSETIELNNASFISDQYNGQLGLECVGTLSKPINSEQSIEEYVAYEEYIGMKIKVDDIENYNYLSFQGMKKEDHGQPFVVVYDENGNVLTRFYMHYDCLDNEWHEYVIDISMVDEPATIIFNGGYIDISGSNYSTYIFSNIMLS